MTFNSEREYYPKPQEEIAMYLQHRDLMGLNTKRALLAVLKEKLSILPAISGYASGYGLEDTGSLTGNRREIDDRAILLNSSGIDLENRVVLNYQGIHRIPKKFRNNYAYYDHSAPEEIAPHEYLDFANQSLSAIEKSERSLENYLKSNSSHTTTDVVN